MRDRTLRAILSVTLLFLAIPLCAQDKKKDQHEQLVIRLIQASKNAGESDAELRDILPALKNLGWSRFQQVSLATRPVQDKGIIDRLKLGDRLILELAFRGREGKQLVVDVKLFLDSKEVLSGAAKFGQGDVCLTGRQAGDEAWIVHIKRR